MSAMIDNAIEDLEKHKDEISALIILADAEDFQILKLGANGATTAQLLALIGGIERVKLRILDAIEQEEENTDDTYLQ